MKQWCHCTKMVSLACVAHVFAKKGLGISAAHEVGVMPSMLSKLHFLEARSLRRLRRAVRSMKQIKETGPKFLEAGRTIPRGVNHSDTMLHEFQTVTDRQAIVTRQVAVVGKAVTHLKPKRLRQAGLQVAPELPQTPKHQRCAQRLIDGKSSAKRRPPANGTAVNTPQSTDCMVQDFKALKRLRRSKPRSAGEPVASDGNEIVVEILCTTCRRKASGTRQLASYNLTYTEEAIVTLRGSNALGARGAKEGGEVEPSASHESALCTGSVVREGKRTSGRQTRNELKQRKSVNLKQRKSDTRWPLDLSALSILASLEPVDRVFVCKCCQRTIRNKRFSKRIH
eukprot:gnl/MRDRNA2_/MRDRNA2_83406_c0_seq3.p1 gnl/MRDRNA2_/MRDRNA2_83406_c0~~gnl/MRDRNA2_/MRDRNA2_83406_c0_seq3.p1  ORF type:complete len:340 (+),score=43.85 gnl/MRDRNA2_/MRDRNA2_83406_c0_seq3:279-1298(+)